MKKILKFFFFILLLTSCAKDSDSDCGNAYLILTNKTSFSIGITVNGNYKTLSSNEVYRVRIQPNSSVTYKGAAGQYSWGGTFTLEDCETKSVRLTNS